VKEPTRIIGVTLVRNEEYFVTWAVANVLDFCDEVILLDNLSTDRTGEKLAALAARHPKVRVHSVEDPNQSHHFLEDFAGEDVWVFGVDGDEIYDRDGLARLRPKILDGTFDPYWRIDGHMLHSLRVTLDPGMAEGHITPQTPGGTKLYNFGAIDSWKETKKERLHGQGMVFRPGHSKSARCALARRESWEGCDLRALHLCFFPRSSQDQVDPALRQNPADLRATGVRRALEGARNFLANPFQKDASYKTRRYRRGPVVQREISGFGRPSDFSSLDPYAGQAEKILD
jgi:glycosyltransferase involved in cell wall biosynthesis